MSKGQSRVKVLKILRVSEKVDGLEKNYRMTKINRLFGLFRCFNGVVVIQTQMGDLLLSHKITQRVFQFH